MDIEEIRTIVNFLKENDIVDFELKRGEDVLKLSRGKPAAQQAPSFPAGPQYQPQYQSPSSYAAQVEPVFWAAHQAASGVPAPTAPAPTAPAALNPNLKKVESPIVGTFYRKSGPDSPLFAKEGDKVRKGQTLCIIEAMKVMNEIESPCDGTIEKVLPADGEVIEYGEVLFLINP